MRLAFAIGCALALAVSPALAKKGHHHEHEQDQDDGGDCKDKLTDHGDQRPSEAMAMAAADKAWIQSVRFKYGEQYTDIKLSRPKAEYTCANASVNGVLHRCEVTARPCKPVPRHATKD